jgi:hypothetical protein
MIEHHMRQARLLHQQFKELLNMQIDEYDLGVSQIKKRREVLGMVSMDDEEREKLTTAQVSETNLPTQLVSLF